jgi:hypothetical protein
MLLCTTGVVSVTLLGGLFFWDVLFFGAAGVFLFLGLRWWQPSSLGTGNTLYFPKNSNRSCCIASVHVRLSLLCHLRRLTGVLTTTTTTTWGVVFLEPMIIPWCCNNNNNIGTTAHIVGGGVVTFRLGGGVVTFLEEEGGVFSCGDATSGDIVSIGGTEANIVAGGTVSAASRRGSRGRIAGAVIVVIVIGSVSAIIVVIIIFVVGLNIDIKQEPKWWIELLLLGYGCWLLWVPTTGVCTSWKCLQKIPLSVPPCSALRRVEYHAFYHYLSCKKGVEAAKPVLFY